MEEDAVPLHSHHHVPIPVLAHITETLSAQSCKCGTFTSSEFEGSPCTRCAAWFTTTNKANAIIHLFHGLDEQEHIPETRREWINLMSLEVRDVVYVLGVAQQVGGTVTD